MLPRLTVLGLQLSANMKKAPSYRAGGLVLLPGFRLASG